MNRKNIAVIFGGCSSEYEISLQSAGSVLSFLNRDKYNVLPIGITRDGRWLRYDGSPEKLMDDTWQRDPTCRPAFLSPDRGHGSLVELTAKGLVYTVIDAAFPVLHGKNGEDGTIQGLIELSGIRLIGCGTLASALCMDKDRAHLLVKNAGIRVPDAVSIDVTAELMPSAADMMPADSVTSSADDLTSSADGPTSRAADGSARERAAFLLEKADHLTYPLFVKPIRAGSSYGISKIYSPDQLPGAVQQALKYDSRLIIEENIDGFEVGCAIMDDGAGGMLVGRVDEIELACGFFDYTKKYTEVDSKIHTPARIDKKTEQRIQEAARIIYRTLGCSGFARIDMFLTPEKEIVFNEVNTIPGLTSHSRFPKMMAGIGLSFAEMLEVLVGGAFGEAADGAIDGAIDSAIDGAVPAPLMATASGR